jgi:HAE1 family hydrophobic/amphiphilic exporter-1/multidrug efflux pump
MSLSTLSIKRPVMTIVMNLTIVFDNRIHLFRCSRIPIDPAQVSIRTNYTGANADIIESQITEPLEKQSILLTVYEIFVKRTGSSSITVEFNLDKDLEEAANDVRDKVSQAIRSLPQDIDAPPVVSKADANSDAIISMTVQSDIEANWN